LLVLASGSPRRRELLSRLGVPFRVVVSDAPETIDSTLRPEEQAVALARRKAWAVAARLGTGRILGADTIVELDGDLLGKPRDEAHAARMLRALSGRQHRVIAGLALVDAGPGHERASAVETAVRFRSLSEEAIAAYVASGEPRNKAGAYAIQGLGGALVAAIDGCFRNVVGLPLCETARILEQAGFAIDAREPVCVLPDDSPCPRLV
jgi:septum formation protein